jgi:2-polyprenyl-3-methyl-5-hydroxy-6-metoxy-1,4-benzoquinol methylase
MQCYVCEKDIWHSMGDLSKEGDLRVCKYCGNVAYKIEADNEQKMREFYRKEYRPEPTIANLITTNHKLQYVRVFLREYLQGLGERKIFFGDIGCATGYMIAFFKQMGHQATGCEYTLTFRRFCEKWYGVPIPEELYRKRPYDLLSIYHVLEHMVAPDKKLADYASLLGPEGRFLVSTPEWFNMLEESSGTQLQSFEHLFPKPHINVFSATSLKNLFRKAGLEIEKEDHIQYGQTYLLKKGAPAEIVKENWQEMVDKLQKTKKAIDFYKSGQLEKAVEVWPAFPEAWMELLMGGGNMKDPERQAEVYKRAEPVVGNNARFRGAMGWWHFQHKRYEEAIKSLGYLMTIKPNEQTAMALGACYLEMGRLDEAFEMYHQAQAMNPQKWGEAMTFMCKVASLSPTWDERAMQQIAGQAVRAAGAPEFADPALEPPPVAAE